MAVEDKYVNSDLASDKLASHYARGSKVFAVPYTFEVAAADDNGSIYRVLKGVPHNWIPVKHEVLADAITGATDYDFGIYKSSQGGVDGAVIDADKLADGVTFASGFARGSATDGLVTVGIDEVTEAIYELAGDTLETRELSYDLAWTANTVGSAAGTISGVIWFVQK